MTFHTVAFSEAMTSTNLGSLVTPIIDPTVTISGDNLLVPDKYNQVFAAAAFATASSTISNVQIQTPSLRETYFPNINPPVLGSTFASARHTFEVFDNPIPLKTNEGLNVYSDASLASPSDQFGALVFLSDGKRAPVMSSQIFTMRCTAAITLSANTWVNGALVFNQTLPVANYDVVGMRAEGTGLRAARLVFVGTSAITRPGVPGVAASTDPDMFEYRMGRLGVWGTFNSLTPPSIDALGITGTTQVIYLDLIQR